MPTLRIQLQLLLVLAVGFSTQACQSKQALDLTAMALHQAIVDNNFESFKLISQPELVEKVSKEKFKLFSLAIASLGPLKEKSMTGINVKAGGIRSGTYKLTMEKGRADLKLTVVKGKLNAFNFDGGDIEPALANARKASMLHAAESFLQALFRASYDAFKATAHPALIKEVPLAKFLKVAKLIKSLGDLQEKKQLSAEIKNGKAVGSYRLKFATRTLIFEVDAVYGQLVRYNFKPEGPPTPASAPAPAK